MFAGTGRGHPRQAEQGDRSRGGTIWLVTDIARRTGPCASQDLTADIRDGALEVAAGCR